MINARECALRCALGDYFSRFHSIVYYKSYANGLFAEFAMICAMIVAWLQKQTWFDGVLSEFKWPQWPSICLDARKCMRLELITEESLNMYQFGASAAIACAVLVQICVAVKQRSWQWHGQRSSDRDTKCRRKKGDKKQVKNVRVCCSRDTFQLSVFNAKTDLLHGSVSVSCQMVPSQVNAIKSIWCEVCVFSLVSISFI